MIIQQVKHLLSGGWEWWREWENVQNVLHARKCTYTHTHTHTLTYPTVLRWCDFMRIEKHINARDEVKNEKQKKKTRKILKSQEWKREK